MEAAGVVPYMRERLMWWVMLLDGGERRADEVPELKVSVVSTRVVVGEDGLPSYSGEYRVWPEVTEGKLGGLGVGEHIKVIRVERGLCADVKCMALVEVTSSVVPEGCQEKWVSDCVKKSGI